MEPKPTNNRDDEVARKELNPVLGKDGFWNLESDDGQMWSSTKRKWVIAWVEEVNRKLQATGNAQ